VAEALADPQVAARNGTVLVDHPVLGEVRSVASPFRISGFAPDVARGPFLGEHTAEVLTELCGYTPEQVRALADNGVFGSERGASEIPRPEAQPAGAPVATE
jgi:crotonobetainyl-CoA:carnitine CoA-transferase CaiB-like acyl-CoA transferase